MTFTQQVGGLAKCDNCRKKMQWCVHVDGKRLCAECWKKIRELKPAEGA